MHPRLLTTPLFTVHTFGLLLAAAYVAAFWWLIREGRREGLDVDALSSLGFWAIGGAILGAKALMIARDFPEYAAAPSELFSLSVLTSAGDFYGGFIGALVASAIFFRRHPRLPFWRTADLCGPAIALGQAIGRIGCFMAGDDYGRPTQAAMGRDVHGPGRRTHRRRAAWRPAASRAVVRVDRLPGLIRGPRATQSAQAVRRRGHSGLHDPVRDCSVRPRVLPRRR